MSNNILLTLEELDALPEENYNDVQVVNIISDVISDEQVFKMQIDGFLSWISSFYKTVRVDRMIPSCYPCSDIFSQTMHWIYDTYATLSLFTSLISK